jgi:hypothetical protein
MDNVRAEKTALIAGGIVLALKTNSATILMKILFVVVVGKAIAQRQYLDHRLSISE